MTGIALGERLALIDRYKRVGRVQTMFGTTIVASGLAAGIGQICEIRSGSTGASVKGEVVGLNRDGLILTPLGTLQGLGPDAEVTLLSEAGGVPAGTCLLGRVVDVEGAPADKKGPLQVTRRRPLYSEPPSPMTRQPVDKPLETGIRAIDGLLTIGIGQRLGIFAPAGAGKTTLLGQIAKNAKADIVVVALIGERGREVREFVENVLDEDVRRRCAVFCATSDRPAMERVRLAYAATAAAEAFRAEGKNVLLLMDSITRFARAIREIGLAIGEPPVRRGFPPSVFSELPRLFERAGNDEHGTMTALYTVLVEDEETTDPVAEEARSILDGHIVLTRKLAEAGRFPAIDPLKSESRLFRQITEKGHADAAGKARLLLSKYEEIEMLVQIGEYKKGADPLADKALGCKPKLEVLLRQAAGEKTPMTQTVTTLGRLVS